MPEGPEAGEIYLTGQLDFEEVELFEFIVCATNPTDPTSADPTATQTLTIQVTDVNDNVPKCQSCPFTTSIDENAGEGTKY